LAAQREQWLVIDRSRLSASEVRGVAPIVRSFELGDSRRDVLLRFDRLTGELGLDRERARGWAVRADARLDVRQPTRGAPETAQWLLEALDVDAPSCSTWTSRSRGPGPSSGPRGINASARASG
jgi:streptomycin 6-kinase